MFTVNDLNVSDTFQEFVYTEMRDEMLLTIVDNKDTGAVHWSLVTDDGIIFAKGQTQYVAEAVDCANIKLEEYKNIDAVSDMLDIENLR